jgi:hypothetical protein
MSDQETKTRPEQATEEVKQDVREQLLTPRANSARALGQSPPVCDVFSPTGTSIISLTQALEAEEDVKDVVHDPNNEKRELPDDLQEATPPELAAESSRVSAVGCRANSIDVSVTAEDFFNLVTGAGTLFDNLKINWFLQLT